MPPIFKLIQSAGGVEWDMMYNTFNCGLGMVIAVGASDVDTAMEAIRKAGDTPYIVGEIRNGEKGVDLI